MSTVSSPTNKPARPPRSAPPTVEYMDSFKNAEGKYQCINCEKSYLHFKHLKRHFMKHTGNRPHVCRICQDTFCRSDILKRHYARCLAKFQATGKCSAVSRVPKRIMVSSNPTSPVCAPVAAPTPAATTPAATSGYQQTLFYSYQSNVSTPMASPGRSSNRSSSNRVSAGDVTPTSNAKYFNNLPSPVSPTFQPSFDKQFLYQPAPLPPNAAAAAATMGMSMYPTQPQMKYDPETLNGYYQQQPYSLFYQPYSTGQPGLDPQQHQQQQHQPHQQHQRHSSYYY